MDISFEVYFASLTDHQHLDDFFKANSQSKNDELKSKMVETV